MEICKLVNVEKSYESEENIFPLKKVSLCVNSGDFLCIEGPSGSGKSTLLYIMGGLLSPCSGEVFIDKEDICNVSSSDLSNIRKDKVGFIFQDSFLIEALSVRENLAFIQSIKEKVDYNKIDELLKKLGLYEKRNSLPYQLSGGQRRRVMIACVIIKNPLLILADEPTNDLDDYWASKVLDLLSDLCTVGKGIVLVTHNTYWAKKAKYRYSLKNGELNKIK